MTTLRWASLVYQYQGLHPVLVNIHNFVNVNKYSGKRLWLKYLALVNIPTQVILSITKHDFRAYIYIEIHLRRQQQYTVSNCQKLSHTQTYAFKSKLFGMCVSTDKRLHVQLYEFSYTETPRRLRFVLMIAHGQREKVVGC